MASAQQKDDDSDAQAEKAAEAAARKSPPEWVKTIGPTINITKPDFAKAVAFKLTSKDVMLDSGPTAAFRLPAGTVRMDVRILFKGKHRAELGVMPQSSGAACKAQYDHFMSLGLFEGDDRSALIGKKNERQAIKAGEWIGIYHNQEAYSGLEHREYMVFSPEQSYWLQLSWPVGNKDGQAEAEKQIQFFLWSCKTKGVK